MRRLLYTSVCALPLLAMLGAADAQAATTFSFNMARSAGLPTTCAPNAKATVRVHSIGFAEEMTVSVTGLKPHTPLDLFVIQVPHAPFGVSWYVGDLEADGTGKVTKTFLSRFNVETFAVAPAAGQPAPTPHGTLDAASNPAFKPIHTWHLGTWFNSPAAARANGCANAVTPFNGEHNAGIQVLNTHVGFADTAGPLKNIN